jgi:hypothetical protein
MKTHPQTFFIIGILRSGVDPAEFPTGKADFF